MKRIPKIAWAILCVASLAVCAVSLRYYLLPETVPLLKVRTGAGKISLLLHVGAGILALAAGPFQFSPALRIRSPRLHRRLGYLFFAGVAVGGLAGLYSATITLGGMSARIGFALLALLWLSTAAAALAAIRRRDLAAHREWMVRCFGLTLAAVSLRIQLPLLEAATGSFEDAYRTVAWLSWVPNLIAAELWIRRTRGNPA